MRIIPHSFISLVLSPLLTRAQAPEDGLLECDDTNLVPYLTGVIDGLWANGLTRFEELVVKSLESEEAYAIWENLFYTQEQVTLFAPTDDVGQPPSIADLRRSAKQAMTWGPKRPTTLFEPLLFTLPRKTKPSTRCLRSL